MSTSDVFCHQKSKFPHTDTNFSIKKKSAHGFSSVPSLRHFRKARTSCTKVFVFSFYLWLTFLVIKGVCCNLPTWSPAGKEDNRNLLCTLK